MSYLSRDRSLKPVNNIHSLPFSRDRRSTAEVEDPIDATALPPTDNSSECESVDSDMEDPLK